MSLDLHVAEVVHLPILAVIEHNIFEIKHAYDSLMAKEERLFLWKTLESKTIQAGFKFIASVAVVESHCCNNTGSSQRGKCRIFMRDGKYARVTSSTNFVNRNYHEKYHLHRKPYLKFPFPTSSHSAMLQPVEGAKKASRREDWTHMDCMLKTLCAPKFKQDLSTLVVSDLARILSCTSSDRTRESKHHLNPNATHKGSHDMMDPDLDCNASMVPNCPVAESSMRENESGVHGSIFT